MATHSEAYLESLAACPPEQRIHVTLELQHSTFAEPVRVVSQVGDDMQFGIEAGAVYNGGEMVTFIACPLYAGLPEQREGLPPQCKVSIDNVTRELWPKIKAAMGVREYLKVLYREYVDSDLTEPAYGPVEFVLREVSTGTTLTGTAVVNSLLNKRFPRKDKNYNYVDFPSLLP